MQIVTKTATGMLQDKQNQISEDLVFWRLLMPLKTAKELRTWRVTETSITFVFVDSRWSDELVTVEVTGNADEIAEFGRMALFSGMHSNGSWNPCHLRSEIYSWCVTAMKTQSPEENIKAGLALMCGWVCRDEIDALMELSIPDIFIANNLARTEKMPIMQVLRMCA